MKNNPANKGLDAVPKSFWKKLRNIFISSKGESFGQGTFLFGVFALAFLLPGSPGLILPFIQTILTGLGVGITSEFFKRDSVDYEKIEESVINAFQRLKESESALLTSGLNKDEVENIIKAIKDCAERSSNEQEDMVADLKKALGNEFVFLKELLPNELKSGFDIINGKLDVILRELADIKRMFGERIVITDNRIFVVGYRPPIDCIYGRDALVAEYIELLHKSKNCILCLHGMGGIGKSTIASMIFSELCVETPINPEFGKCVWFSLSQNPDLETILYELLFIISNGKITTIESGKSKFEQYLDLLGTYLTREPILVVLDNIDSAMKISNGFGNFADNRWFDLIRRFSGTKSALVITSRPVPPIMEAICITKPIPGIWRDEALSLMKDKGLRDSDKTLDEAYSLLGGHPMALSTLAVTVTKFMPRCNSYLSKAGEIMDVVRKSPDPKRNPILLFEEVIKPERLPDNEFTILTAMPILFRPETSDAIASLCSEIDLKKIVESLDNLVLRSLVQFNEDNSRTLYSLHPLVAEVSKRFIDDATQLHERIYDYYLSLPWNRETKEPGDVAHLIDAVKHALEINDLGRAERVLYDDIDLSWKLMSLGRYDMALPLHKLEYDVAQKVGGPKDCMNASARIGACLKSMGIYTDALSFLEEALAAEKEAGDRLIRGHILGVIGQVYLGLCDYPKALEYLEKALVIAREVGDKDGEGAHLGRIGQIYQFYGDYPMALKTLEEALAIAREIRYRIGEGAHLGRIGQVYQSLGDYSKALEYFEKALAIAREIGDRYNERAHRKSIGQILLAINKSCEAVPQFEKAHQISFDLGLSQFIEEDKQNLERAKETCEKSKREQ